MISLNLTLVGLSPSTDTTKLFDRSALERICVEQMLLTRERIITDLNKGQGAEGALRPYKQPYVHAIQRGEVFGHDGTQKTSTTPNLRISGLFHDSMTLKVIKNGCELIFAGSHPFGRNKAQKGVTKTDQDERTRRSFRARRGKSGRSSTSGSISNQELAGHLEGLGFVGWFEFSTRDQARIVTTVMDYVESVLKKLVVP